MDFVWLLFGHYMGDIALQSDWQAQNKGRYWYVMLSHCMIWGACICIALQFIGITVTLPIVALLVGGHAIADSIKARLPKRPDTWWHIYPDQAWHVAQIAFIFWTQK